jgi:ATP-dependent exoDNAse (exonuclease V) beta subunit
MDVVNNSEDDIIINASAGCGKTYTLRKISEKIK